MIFLNQFNKLASTGASGALFGVFVAYVMDLVLHAHLAQSYFANVLIFCGSSLVYFALGITAAFDNFSHLGGLLYGLFILYFHFNNSIIKSIQNE